MKIEMIMPEQIKQTQDYFSRGKLLLTGEYMLMHGSWALALPLKPGQRFRVRQIADGKGIITWKSYMFANLWFEGQFRLLNFEPLKSNGLQKAYLIQKILRNAKTLNPGFVNDAYSYYIDTHIEFDLNWGFGAGSSLISNIAYWAQCDPYRLNNLVFNDTGYEIACSRSNLPVHFRLNEGKPMFFEAEFKPVFRDSLYFVYMNKKIDSKELMKKARRLHVGKNEVHLISEITCLITDSEEYEDFTNLVNEHENIISKIVGLEPIGITHFSDFNGTIKSLGGWGGDFILAATKEPYEYVKDYFKSKGLGVFFRYRELVFNVSST